MANHTASEKQLTFHAPGGQRLRCRVRNPDAPLGKVVASVAARLNVAGTFECLDRNSETISPETRLADLPDDEITLASDLTPASAAAMCRRRPIGALRTERCHLRP